MTELRIPDAPHAIEKGVPLKLLLDKEAINQLGANLLIVYDKFDKDAFVKEALKEIESLGIKDRADHIAKAMRLYLPQNYMQAISIILASLTPPLQKTDANGLAPLFYMPHNSFVSLYGVEAEFNNGEDPFDVSMDALYQLTQRFSCEFPIRAFIEKDQERTMAVLYKWMKDPNPHVRRLCSEGSRSRLPWAGRLKSLAEDPTPVIPILEELKDDVDGYVRRSVANHVGDIAKDDLELALTLCEKWLENSSRALKKVIRHAVRNPIKNGNFRAFAIRKAAKVY